MRTDKQNKAGIGVVGRGTISPAPYLVAKTSRGRADIGMAIVTIHAPGAQDALHITVMPRPANVIHDFIATTFNNGGSDFAGKGLQYFVPRCAFPLALTTLPYAFQRIQDTFGIVDLVDGGWSFGTVAPSTARMIGITFKFFDPSRLFVHVSHQATSRLAVEADGRNDLVVLLYLARPCSGIVFDPIVPAFRRRTRCEVTNRHRLPAWRDMLP